MPTVSDFSPMVIEGSSPGVSLVFNSRHIQFCLDDRPNVGSGEIVRPGRSLASSMTRPWKAASSSRGEKIVFPSAISKHEEAYPLTETVVTLRHR